ncbi:MAG: hypothetical protein KKC84_04205, partial [Candidatus Omnitrophica bacterium]|nr:hypothetical protein [Candidatus Omnitrophota bacterium]
MKRPKVIILRANEGKTLIKKSLAKCSEFQWIYFGRNTHLFYTVKEVVEIYGGGESINTGEM